MPTPKKNVHPHEPALKPITEIAQSIGLGEDDLEHYGRYKAKVRL